MTRSGFLASLAVAMLLSQAASANEPPVVDLLSATPFVNDQTTISYVVHDADDDVEDGLTYSLFAYPDERLSSVSDVMTFATRIADQLDVDPVIGTGHFVESTAPTKAHEYTWGDPGPTLQNQGWAPARAFFPGTFYLYLVADDGNNEPVMAVSSFTIQVNHVATAVAQTSWGVLKTVR